MKTMLMIGCMVGVLLCVSAQAQELEIADEAAGSNAVTCQQGSLSRMVEVTYAGNQGEPPCEVHYRKTVEQPGHDEVLWTSQHTRDYCETKQREFVAKLESWGWNCQ